MLLDMRLAAEILGPPAFLNTGTACWADLARQGVRFPESFKVFLDAYGSGELAEFVQFAHPLNESASLRTMVLDAAVDYAPIVEGGYLPRRFFPEPGGLLPWAGSSTGDLFSFRWKPDGRHVICVLTDALDYIELADDFDEMMMKVLRRENPWPWYDTDFAYTAESAPFHMWRAFDG